MAGLVIYVAGAPALTGERARELGIEDLVGAFQTSGCACRGGPDGGQGCTVAGPGCVAPGYHASLQTWRADAATPGLWYGWAMGEPPGPAELARPAGELIAGHEVVLGDGRSWLVPIARRFDGTTDLPRRLQLGPDGRWVHGEVLERFAPLAQQAERFMDVMLKLAAGRGGEADQILEDEAVTFTLAALQVNYRLTAGLASALGIFTTANWPLIIKSILDWSTFVREVNAWEAAQGSKKNDGPSPDDGPSSKPGGPDGSPDTAPPAPTSPSRPLRAGDLTTPNPS